MIIVLKHNRNFDIIMYKMSVSEKVRNDRLFREKPCIMPALFPLLTSTYYSRNYAGINYSSLDIGYLLGLWLQNRRPEPLEGVRELNRSR